MVPIELWHSPFRTFLSWIWMFKNHFVLWCLTNYLLTKHWKIRLFAWKYLMGAPYQGAASLTTLTKIMTWWRHSSSFWRNGLTSLMFRNALPLLKMVQLLSFFYALILWKSQLTSKWTHCFFCLVTKWTKGTSLRRLSYTH